MDRPRISRLQRREFLEAALSVGAAGLPGLPGQAAGAKPQLLAGEGVVDITPPLGIEMGGFHRKPGSERRIKAIRQPTAVRALVLAMGGVQIAICSIDVAAVGKKMADRLRKQVAAKTGIPADNVHLCATHTHSMPAFCYLRQWGAARRVYGNC